MATVTHEVRRTVSWPQVGVLVWAGFTVLSVGLFLAGLPQRYAQLLTVPDPRTLQQLGLTAQSYATYLLGLFGLIVLVHLLTAGVIVWRRAHDPMALFVALSLVANGSLIPLAVVYGRTGGAGARHPVVDAVIYVGLVTSIVLLYVFPTGRFVPRWTAPLAAAWALLLIPALYLPQAPWSLSAWPLGVQALVLAALSGSGIYAQLHRYLYESTPAQRQQTKWAVLGLAAAALGPFGYFLPFVILPALGQPGMPNFLYQLIGATFFTVSLIVQLVGLALFTLLALVFPITFAIAILRYRLWDIDVLINRTLVYALLTAALTLLYLIGVVGMQQLFRAFTGQQSELAVVVTTLAIAALFQPLRERTQTFIDRRLYRRKYDVARTLAYFGQQLQEDVDLDRLCQDLVAIVEETMEPEHVSLWLRQT